MNSALLFGNIWHERVTPAQHGFTYPLCRYLYDVDELARLDKELPLFGYNRFAPASLYDRDYLDTRPGTIREKVVRLLRERGVEGPADRILMVTDVACFRAVFNPVSFYYVFAATGTLTAILLEVNNVVGDRHLYLLPGDTGSAETGFMTSLPVAKAFHVSPFNTVEGYYKMRFADVRERLEAHIDLYRDEGLVMTACIWEKERVPLTRESLRHALWRPVLAPWHTMPRILWQAARLAFGKKLTFHDRPVAVSPMTIRIRAATGFQRLCRRSVEAALSRIRTGALEFQTPDGHGVFGAADAAFRAEIQVRDWAFFSRLATGGDIGFGEAYMEGLWDTPDLNAVIRLMIENSAELADRRLAPTLVNAGLNRLGHLLHDNTLRGSGRNIHAHYDLSNAFFKTFLDPSMSYSCGLYRHPDESLEQAQMNKLDAIIDKARIQPSDHILEIGCGWGGFALRAAQTRGCRVTGLTISPEQHAEALERVRAAGLEDRVTILLQDYRTYFGVFDKVVSIEMLEAVGHRHLGTFFRKCDEFLKQEGLAVVQVITIPDQRYEAYRKGCDWIQKHIFPGGHLPSLKALTHAMATDSSFIVEHLENVGVHYARTLSEWKRLFLRHPDHQAALEKRSGFHRKWLYYFCYCQAAFESRTLENLQLVLTRPGNPSLPQAPYGAEGA